MREAGTTLHRASAQSTYAGGILLAFVATAIPATAASVVLGDGTAPAFDHPPTPDCGVTIPATMGTATTFTVQASDPDEGDVITLTAENVPNGATVTPPLPATGNPVSVEFSWSSNSAGLYEIVFTATDDSANAVICNIPIDIGIAPPTTFCASDGAGSVAGVACPCGNSGSPGNGCANSDHPGGANLSASGTNSVSADTLVLTVTDQHAGFLQLFIQGNEQFSPKPFGDGLRCINGNLKRMFRVVAAHSTTVSAPSANSIPPAPATISGQSASRGDRLTSGDVRGYQVYYRDNNPTFCPSPTGSTFNITNAIQVIWGP